MTEQKQGKPRKRRYPAVYERLVPVSIAIIVAIILILLAIILSVALGFFPGSG